MVTQEEKTHQLQTSKAAFQNSFWMECTTALPHLLDTAPLEAEYIEDIVNNLLNEFTHTSPEVKQTFEPLLTNWLIEMSELEEEPETHQQVGELIYEMF